MDSSPTPRSRIDTLALYWAKIGPSRYTDRKKARLLWETAFFVFEGRYVPFNPAAHPGGPDRPERTPQ
jgi:hypothetical protein